MARYLVTWTIDIDADSPEEAATEAANIQADPESCALFFDVKDQDTGAETLVDLYDEGGV